jgi:hypothetical protein
VIRIVAIKKQVTKKVYRPIGSRGVVAMHSELDRMSNRAANTHGCSLSGGLARNVGREKFHRRGG